MSFPNTDMLLPDAELSQLTAALANAGVADPIAKVATECGAVVDQYTAGYSLPEDWRDRLIRALAPAELYRLAGSGVPESQQTAWDAAMKELRDIRDGKFPSLSPSTTAPTPAATGRWGGACRKLAFLLIFNFALLFAMPATAQLRPTIEVLNAVVAALTPLKWTPVGGPEQNLFAAVEIFDEPDMVKALQRLILNQDRVALVIFAGERWEKAVSGRVLVSQRQQSILVLICDRVIGDERGAMCGTATHPGTLGIKDRVYAAVSGPLLPNPLGINVSPEDGEPVFIQDIRTKLPGRAIYSQSFTAHGGWLEAEDTTYSPIL